MKMSKDILEKSIGKTGIIIMTLFEPYLKKCHSLVTIGNWYTNEYGTVDGRIDWV